MKYKEHNRTEQNRTILIEYNQAISSITIQQPLFRYYISNDFRKTDWKIINELLGIQTDTHRYIHLYPYYIPFYPSSG